MVGGLGVEGADGSSLIVNVPTVGRIPGGGTVERLIETGFLDTDNLILNLHQGDFSITNQVAEAINDVFGGGIAVPLDLRSVKVRAPVDPSQKVSFISMLENIEIEPERQSAKVVVNARTGTVVIGGDVRVTPAAVTHGSLTVRVDENPTVTQQNAVAAADGALIAAPGEAVETEDTAITVDQEPARAFMFDPGVELSEIVEAINAVGTSPADLVAILEALREAGSLRAELVIIIGPDKRRIAMEIMHKIDPLLAANLTKTPNVNAELSEVAEQFEAIFINQFLAQSRKTKLADDLFGNKGTETYTSLLDQERAQQLANSVDLGIADALVRQLGGNRDAE